MKNLELVEYNMFGNEKLQNKYNAIVNFVNKIKGDVVIECGCYNDVIINIEYIRNEIRGILKTDDNIKIYTASDKVLWIENPSELKINRKYKIIELKSF